MIVDLLVANYNNGKYFEECFQSVLRQTYQNWRLIVVDDHSTDNSVEIIENLIRNDNRCQLICLSENHGVGYVKNKLASIAKGEFAGFLDPDDVLMPEAITLLVQILDNDPSIIAAYSNYCICNNKLEECTERPNKPFGIRESNSFWRIGIGTINPIFIFRLAAYHQTAGINPAYRIGEDIDLYLKLEEFGSILHIEEVGYKVRRHSQSLTAERNSANHWVWIMRVLYETGIRRVSNNIISYSLYSKMILDQIVYYLKDCIQKNDIESYKTIKKEFYLNPFHRKFLRSFIFFKYIIRHYNVFFKK